MKDRSVLKNAQKAKLISHSQGKRGTSGWGEGEGVRAQTCAVAGGSHVWWAGNAGSPHQGGDPGKRETKGEWADWAASSDGMRGRSSVIGSKVIPPSADHAEKTVQCPIPDLVLISQGKRSPGSLACVKPSNLDRANNQR